MGAVGYCMGGRFALTAATLGERVAAAASLHGSMLAPAQGDSPHHHFAGVRSSVYIGVAGVDPSFGAEEEGRLATALRAADVNHTIETYAGAAHGFVMDDLPVHDAAAAERHWLRISAQLREAFAR
jgi:carboxymethylenebutenolidase